MPASTLPTRSAPTSAALVKIPPPTRAKSATEDAPKPKDAIAETTALTAVKSPNPPNATTRMMKSAERPSNPRPTTDIPMTDPDAKETLTAAAIPRFAALVVLTFALVALVIPMYPAHIERAAPMR